MSEPGIWTEVSLRVATARSEEAAELLQEFTGAGVTIEPPIRALGPDEGYVLDEEAPLTLRAYLYGRVLPPRRSTLTRRLKASGLSGALAGRLAWRELREEDWAEAWKEHYDIERVGRVVIRPAWRQYEPGAGEVVVSLDPGMAFGTGQHPTTRMCLKAMQSLVLDGQHVLDLGCGSGILAFAALRLGASGAVAADTEEQAVAATRANAALNGLQQHVQVYLGSIEAVGGHAPFDVVLANINAATLIALADDISRALKTGGSLVASGIIGERERDCLDAFAAASLKLERRLQDGDWRGFVLTRV